MSKLIIGISGVAGVGKDTFFSFFKDYIEQKYKREVIRYAFADELKQETNEWCLKHYGLPAIDTPREKKEILRPFLVFHGNVKRTQSLGQHWINIIDKKIKENENPDAIICITDVRYQSYERDEVTWLKNELGGILLHVSMFEQTPLGKKFKLPPNEQEEYFDPIIKKASDYWVEWEKQPNSLGKLIPHVEQFADFLKQNGRI